MNTTLVIVIAIAGFMSAVVAIVSFFRNPLGLKTSTKVLILIIAGLLLCIAYLQNNNDSKTSIDNSSNITPTISANITPANTVLPSSTTTLAPTQFVLDQAAEKESTDTAHNPAPSAVNDGDIMQSEYTGPTEGYLDIIPDEAPAGYYIVVEYHFPGKSKITTRFIDYVKPDIDYTKADGYWWLDSRHITTNRTNELFLEKYGKNAVLIDNVGVGD